VPAFEYGLRWAWGGLNGIFLGVVLCRRAQAQEQKSWHNSRQQNSSIHRSSSLICQRQLGPFDDVTTDAALQARAPPRQDTNPPLASRKGVNRRLRETTVCRKLRLLGQGQKNFVAMRTLSGAPLRRAGEGTRPYVFLRV